MLSTVIVIDAMFWLKVVSYVCSVVMVGYVMYNRGCDNTADAFGDLLEQIGLSDQQQEIKNIEQPQYDIKALKDEINRLEQENLELKRQLEKRN